jgi:hypothetical protein
MANKSDAQRKQDERDRMRARGYVLQQKWIHPESRSALCARVGANVYGRIEVALEAMESNDDEKARRELLALLKFFPPRPKR